MWVGRRIYIVPSKEIQEQCLFLMIQNQEGEKKIGNVRLESHSQIFEEASKNSGSSSGYRYMPKQLESNMYKGANNKKFFSL